MTTTSPTNNQPIRVGRLSVDRLSRPEVAAAAEAFKRALEAFVERAPGAPSWEEVDDLQQEFLGLAEALKPCPFCGGTRVSVESELRAGYAGNEGDLDARAYFGWCAQCAAQGPWFKSPGNARRFWNKREDWTQC